MAVKKLDYKQMTIAYTGASAASVIAGAVSAGLWDRLGGNVDYGLWIGGAWLVVVGVPSMVVASDTLLKVFGKRTPVQIISNAGKSQGRPVPINHGNGKQSHVFLSAIQAPLRLIGGGNADPEPQPAPSTEVPQSFTVVIDDVSYRVPITDIRDFLHIAWQRQRQGKPAFSRPYWTKKKRPRMHPKEHRALMLVLEQMPGLVVNRGKGRSGKLALPPEATVKTLQGLM